MQRSLSSQNQARNTGPRLPPSATRAPHPPTCESPIFPNEAPPPISRPAMRRRHAEKKGCKNAPM